MIENNDVISTDGSISTDSKDYNIKEKKEDLVSKKLQITIYTNIKFNILVIALAMVFLLSLPLVAKYGNDIIIALGFSGAVTALTPYEISSLIINKKINKLNIEIEEIENMLREAKQQEIRNKVKTFSKNTKRLLCDMSNNAELKNIKSRFGMTYEKLLELYEESNGLMSDSEIDKAIDSLDIISYHDSEDENKYVSSPKNKRKKNK